MSIDSISEGFKVISGLVGAPLLDSSSLINGTPSRTYKGLEPALILDCPLIRKFNPASTLPLVWLICTPATLPVIALKRFGVGTSLKSSDVTLATLSVKVTFF